MLETITDFVKKCSIFYKLMINHRLDTCTWQSVTIKFTFSFIKSLKFRDVMFGVFILLKTNSQHKNNHRFEKKSIVRECLKAQQSLWAISLSVILECSILTVLYVVCYQSVTRNSNNISGYNYNRELITQPIPISHSPAN